jgi:hypothetical protein
MFGALRRFTMYALGWVDAGSYLQLVFDQTTQLSELRRGVYVPTDAPKGLVGAALVVALGEAVTPPPPQPLAARMTNVAATRTSDRRNSAF